MSQKFVHMIYNEAEKVPQEITGRIFMVGVSQGCMMTLSTLLSWDGDTPWGGVVCMLGLNPFDYKVQNDIYGI